MAEELATIPTMEAAYPTVNCLRAVVLVWELMVSATVSAVISQAAKVVQFACYGVNGRRDVLVSSIDLQRGTADRRNRHAVSIRHGCQWSPCGLNTPILR